MTPKSLKVAELDPQGLARLRQLEDELGTTIVAYQVDPPYAPLSEEQLRRLQQAEQELGVVLLAYRQSAAAIGAD